jgi:hypothetical protein
VGGAFAFCDLPDDPAAGSTGYFALNMPDAGLSGHCKYLDFTEDALWDFWMTEMLSSRLGGSHAGGHSLVDER